MLLSRSSSFAAVCATCHHSQRQCKGKCACTIDGKDIMEHIAERYCPIGRYKLGLGDVVARITHATGIQALTRKMKGKRGCGGCKKRQLRLNQIGDRDGK